MKKMTWNVIIAFAIFFVGPGFVYAKIGTMAAVQAMVNQNHIQILGSTVGLSIMAFCFFALGKWGPAYINRRSKNTPDPDDEAGGTGDPKS